MEKIKKNRIWELDLLRGLALCIMIYFHCVFDLVDIYGYHLNYESGSLFILGRIAVTIFIVVAGISSTLSNNNVRRGLKVIAIAIAITIITHLVDPALGVKFGILHFMGMCMILYPLLSKLNNTVLFAGGVLVIFIGNYFEKIIAKNDWLFMFNITTNEFSSSDYYPLFPWMGIFLFGIVIGRRVYLQKKSRFNYQMSDNLLLLAGRNTLIVYVLH